MVSSTSAAPLRPAIVTTLRSAAPVLDSFVRYHLALGFERLYLFFDDPSDPELARTLQRGGPRVSIFQAGSALEEAWRACAQYSHYLPYLGAEVMARQALNVEVAVQHALADRIDWLLHIDADELFHAPGQDAASHFTRLSAMGIERAVYPNLEAVPEAEAIGDYFREVTLFKVNPNLMPGGHFSPAQQSLVDTVPSLARQFFLFYSNGKSAARVRPGLVPDGVHRFHKTRYPRPGQEAIAAGPAAIEHVIGDCRVLHYACCGFDTFVDKYRILGPFADRWFGTVDIRDSIGGFHMAARDVVAPGDEASARSFYRERAMLDDGAQIESLIGAGVLTRIDQPARWLRGETGRLP